MRRALPVVLGLALALLAPISGQAQESAVRFEIAGVADSTFAFRVGRHVWVVRGQRGIIVDPRQRDVLVGRFRIMRVEGGLATALVTGQTTTISSLHVALLTPPRLSWYRDRNFWIGAAVGGVLGLVLGGL